MVNPCAYKGIAIFLSLAKALPDVQFAAVPTWGTSQVDYAQMAHCPNIRLLRPSDEIDDILRLSRVLLVPSLWAEAKANMITEAMLRGIPVLSSDVGGNSEAHLGVDYLLPVTPIREFRAGLDDQMLPIANVPEQIINPWLDALKSLADRTCYETISDRSRTVAAIANRGQTVDSFESYLESLTPRSNSRLALG
jgi:hypothetical protein